ncbi:hypothetical protein DET49_10994 [Salegentibacter sp. 24]|nr:hypothetical protein DET49_10994 [Salegentibacter sp. 24]
MSKNKKTVLKFNKDSFPYKLFNKITNQN